MKNLSTLIYHHPLKAKFRMLTKLILELDLYTIFFPKFYFHGSIQFLIFPEGLIKSLF